MWSLALPKSCRYKRIFPQKGYLRLPWRSVHFHCCALLHAVGDIATLEDHLGTVLSPVTVRPRAFQGAVVAKIKCDVRDYVTQTLNSEDSAVL